MIIKPIFICDRIGGDIAVFGSVEDVESQLEVVDIRNEEYLAYDSVGRQLCLMVENGAVKISAVEKEPSHVEELRQKLSAFLIAAKIPDISPTVSLAALVDLATPFLYERTNIGRLFKKIRPAQKK